MKKLILVFGLASMPFFAASQTATFVSYNTNTVATPSSYSSTTFARTYKTELSPSLQLPCNFTVKTTKGSRIIAEVTVLANCSPAILKALMSAGRYELDINTMTFPKLEKTIFINGSTALDEQIKVVLYIGDGTELK